MGADRGLLICGEPGSGKVLHARGLGEAVVLDIRAAKVNLLEAALFGWERSYCWGPKPQLTVHRSAFELAGEGTLVLDEIAAIPEDIAKKLGRVLEERSYRRIGARPLLPITARVVATTSTPDAVAPRLRRMFDEVVLPPLRGRLAQVAPALTAAARARLENLALPLDVERVRRVADADDPDAALLELELLAAIVASPADDAPRLVYADLLTDRGDPRGELIHLQCTRPNAARRTRERRLLALYGDAWRSDVLAVPHVTSATLRRGFVEVVGGTWDVTRARELVRRAAPLLDELTAS